MNLFFLLAAFIAWALVCLGDADGSVHDLTDLYRLPADAPCMIPYPLDDENRHALQNISDLGGVLGASTPFGATGDGVPKKWPRSSGSTLTTIPYCYNEEGDRQSARLLLENAINAWYRALGGRPGPNTRHSIRFKETMDGSQPIYCFDKNNAANKHWNTKLSYNTIPVFWMGDVAKGASATVGLIEKNPAQPRLMYMHLGSSADVADTVHELGHILGFGHEHQRPDRDNHVKYQCHMSTDFKEKWDRASKDGVKLVDFCERSRVAEKYGFSGAQYAKGNFYFVPPIDKEVAIHGGGTPYERESIMHYDSYGFASLQCRVSDMSKCPLLKWTNNHGGTARIERNMNPSKGDVDWLKATYPWA